MQKERVGAKGDRVYKMTKVCIHVQCIRSSVPMVRGEVMRPSCIHQTRREGVTARGYNPQSACISIHYINYNTR